MASKKEMKTKVSGHGVPGYVKNAHQAEDCQMTVDRNFNIEYAL
jgi:hypothetical protein